jgi:hypothetical protein
MTVTLAPIRTGAYHQSARTGRQECWEAETLDGQWTFVRMEETGTPWLIYHAGESTPQTICGTLRTCRAWVATR